MDPLTLTTGALDFHKGPLDPEAADRLFPLRGGWSATYGVVLLGRAVGVRADRAVGRAGYPSVHPRTYVYLRSVHPPGKHPAGRRSQCFQPHPHLGTREPAPLTSQSRPCTYCVPTRTYSYDRTSRDEYLQTSSYTKNTLNVEKRAYLHSSPTITTSTPPAYLFRTYSYLLTARSVMTYPSRFTTHFPNIAHRFIGTWSTLAFKWCGLPCGSTCIRLKTV